MDLLIKKSKNYKNLRILALLHDGTLPVSTAQDNSSTIIEVRLRPSQAQWRYRLDVLADKRRVYFDRQSLKIQHFQGMQPGRLAVRQSATAWIMSRGS